MIKKWQRPPRDIYRLLVNGSRAEASVPEAWRLHKHLVYVIVLCTKIFFCEIIIFPKVDLYSVIKRLNKTLFILFFRHVIFTFSLLVE